MPSDVPHQVHEEQEEIVHDHSLFDDFSALLSDGKTYVEAEIAYQKSRAGFAGSRLKRSVIYGAAAFGLLHLALIALAVGAVIALSPLVGPWLATGIVVLFLLVLALVFISKLRSSFREIRDVFDGDE